MIRGEVDKASLRKLQQNLEKRKERAIRRANVKKALRPGAEMGLDEARRRVPVLTGALRDSLKIRVYGNSLLVKTDLKYATYQEFKNRSYMRATIEGRKEDMINVIKDEYKKIVIE